MKCSTRFEFVLETLLQELNWDCNTAPIVRFLPGSQPQEVQEVEEVLPGYQWLLQTDFASLIQNVWLNKCWLQVSATNMGENCI